MKLINNVWLAALLLLASGLAACSVDSAESETVPPTAVQTPQPEEPAAPNNPEGEEGMVATEIPAGPPTNTLAGSDWILTGFGPAGEPIPEFLADGLTLAIGAGSVSGHAGCNSFSGELALTESQFTLDMLAITAMACMEEERMVFETDYLQALSAVTGWSLTGDTLTLTTGEISLVYIEKLPQPAAALEETDWQFNGVGNGVGDAAAVASPVVGTTATLQLSGGAVSGNTGCNSFSGSYTLAESTLSLSKLLHTMKACEELVSRQETAILTGLQNVESWEIKGNQLRLNYPGGFLMYVVASE